MVDPLHDDERSADAADADRSVKVEQLLLSGLDHYFRGRYERAIDLWTRVLFLDRSHARARAYIERARAALAERLRESEELVHTGVEAFNRGDVTEARSLLTSAVERGGGRDEALTILDRLDRLEAAAGDEVVVKPDAQAPEMGRHEQEHRVAPARRVRVLPLVLFMGVVVGAGYLATSGGQWESLLRLPASPRTVTPVTGGSEELPLVSGTEVKVARAARLVDEGRLHEALAVLDEVGPGDTLAARADALRATIQRQLLVRPATSTTGTLGSGTLRP